MIYYPIKTIEHLTERPEYRSAESKRDMSNVENIKK